MNLINIALLIFAVIVILIAIYDFMDRSHPKNYRYQQTITSIIMALGIFTIAIFDSTMIDCCGMIVVVGAALLHIYLQKRYLDNMISSYNGDN